MNASVLAAAAVVALAAAIRSTWSPCGLSMLSTITPLTERARGHRFWVTASWFVLGAVLGGATLGLIAAGAAAAVAATGVSAGAVLIAAALLAVLAGAIDLGAFGPKPPFFKRQVNDDWLRQYRPWVYGAGFGWQIGFGLATYIMTVGVILTAVLAALSASPVAAFAVGVGFGLARGLAVFFGVRATSPAAMRSLHARFDALEAPVRNAVTAVELVVGVALAAIASPAAGVAAAALAVACVLVAAPRVRRATVTGDA